MVVPAHLSRGTGADELDLSALNQGRRLILLGVARYKTTLRRTLAHTRAFR